MNKNKDIEKLEIKKVLYKKYKIIKLFMVLDNHRNIFMLLDNHRNIFMLLDNHRKS